jgi:hypothetical protein
MSDAAKAVHPLRCMLLAAACVIAGRGSLEAQTIDGLLLERGTDRPIDLALVTLHTAEGDSVSSTLTDASGRFRVEASWGGDFLLSATALGYRSTTAGVFELGEGGRITLEFRLEAQAIEIGGITIEARSSLLNQPNLIRNGFVERAQRGFGRFITPADIEKSATRSTTELLTQTGRITTRYAIGGDRILMRGQVGYCTPTVYLDGVRYSMTSMSVDQLVSVSALEAVEVYRTANEAPVRYGGGMSGCGIILLWTRAR